MSARKKARKFQTDSFFCGRYCSIGRDFFPPIPFTSIATFSIPRKLGGLLRVSLGPGAGFHRPVVRLLDLKFRPFAISLLWVVLKGKSFFRRRMIGAERKTLQHTLLE